jgi:hypothetical protein
MAVTGEQLATLATATVQDLPDGRVSGTTGAAGAMVSAATPRRSSKRIVALLATVALAVLGVSGFIRIAAHGGRAEPVAAVGHALVPEAPELPSMRIDPPSPPAKAVDSVTLTLPALEPEPPVPSSASVPPTTRNARRTAQASTPRVRAPTRALKQAAPSAPAILAPSSEKETRKAMEAWDPSTFGPRR